MLDSTLFLQYDISIFVTGLVILWGGRKNILCTKQFIDMKKKNLLPDRWLDFIADIQFNCLPKKITRIKIILLASILRFQKWVSEKSYNIWNKFLYFFSHPGP